MCGMPQRSRMTSTGAASPRTRSVPLVWGKGGRTALVWVGGTRALPPLKSAPSLLTDSAAILSDAAESVVNVLAANIALISLVIASRPPAEGHQYGHGKAEDV